ncbi:hypothetical protein DL346_20055 [Paenibacillus montanisoli]|uniref:Uncharacterized protein n=1 Tax=Paenibacillus montanisoli TaxID=2081970 RepID=A0A328TV30_9BACL|nr:hypothetical protein DL346_20055 [Paenibacillus montanisoli]
MLWMFHQYDVDPFPSVPHGHSIEPMNRYKLDVNTGEVYDNNRKVVGRADRKELRLLKSDRKFKALAARAREFHLSGLKKEKHVAFAQKSKQFVFMLSCRFSESQ